MIESESKETIQADDGQRGSKPAVRQNPQDTVNLIDLGLYYIGHIKWIIMLILIGAIAAFAYTYFCVTPMYQATAKMYIVSASNDSVVNLSDLQIGSNLTSDYKELITSKTIVQELISARNIYTNYETLVKQISVSNPSDTRIITITVTYNDPYMAADIANGLAELAVAYLPTVMKTDEPYVYEHADVPSKKSSPSLSKNTIWGAMLLALCYVGILTVRYLMDDSLKGPQDMVKWLGIEPLSVIPDMADLKSKRYGYGYGRARRE